MNVPVERSKESKMNEYIQFSAKTVDEAITKAAIELGIASVYCFGNAEATSA